MTKTLQDCTLSLSSLIHFGWGGGGGGAIIIIPDSYLKAWSNYISPDSTIHLLMAHLARARSFRTFSIQFRLQLFQSQPQPPASGVFVRPKHFKSKLQVVAFTNNVRAAKPETKKTCRGRDESTTTKYIQILGEEVLRSDLQFRPRFFTSHVILIYPSPARSALFASTPPPLPRRCRPPPNLPSPLPPSPLPSQVP